MFNVVKVLLPFKCIPLEKVRGAFSDMSILSRDSRFVINFANKKIFVWDSETGELITKRKLEFNLPYIPDIDASNHTLLLFRKKNLLIYSLPDVKFIKEIRDAHKKHIKCVKFSPDRNSFITASKSEIKIWDLNGNQLYTLSGLKLDILYMGPAYDPRSKVVAYSFKNRIILKKVDTEEEITSIMQCQADFDSGPGIPVAISMNDNFVVSLCETSINLYSISPPKCLMKILHFQPLTAARHYIEGYVTITKADSISMVLETHTGKITYLTGHICADDAVIKGKEIKLIGFKNPSEPFVMIYKLS